MADFSDPGALRLPPLQQTVLDPATVQDLFRDLAACTQIIAIRPKTRAEGHIDAAATLTLDDAAAGLRDGSFRAVQVRYRYEDQEWCDTLMSTPAGLRVVRICQDDVAATIEPEA